MAYTIIDISKDFITSKPYPGDPLPELSVYSSIASGDSCNMARLNATLHCGTHADAPLHFFEKGKTINSIPPKNFIGECCVIEISSSRITGEYVDRYFPKDEKKLLLKSGGKAYFDKTGAEEAAYYGYTLIGTDANSIGCKDDQAGPHKAFLEEGIAILENLELSHVKPGKYFLVAAPVKIAGVEAAPARALLLDGYVFWSN